MAADEGELDPWVANWFRTSPFGDFKMEELSPEILTGARQASGFPSDRQVSQISDETVGGVPIRVYQNDADPAGVVVYFHGGGFCVGSIDMMDNIARELVHASGAVVVSVGYRLAPENPYPAGVDDAEAVTRWVLANTDRWGVSSSRVVVAGESAGGSLAAVVALRLRDSGENRLAGQLLLYPGLDTPDSAHPARTLFADIRPVRSEVDLYWNAYTAGRDLSADPYVVPLRAERLAGLPPALVVIGGCDFLRDDGRAYVKRLQAEGVPAEEFCLPGQPHGWLNFGFPAAAPTYEKIGAWFGDLWASQRVSSPG